MTLGLDIGASKTLGVLVKEGKVQETKKQKTDPNETLKFVINFIRDFTRNQSIDFIGLSVAGSVDSAGKKVLAVGNLQSLPGLPLKKEIEEEFKVPVKMENDGTCFIWAEFLQGAAQGAESAIGLTLGTGVGGGFVSRRDRKPVLFHGAFSSAFEVGHTIIRAGGAKCGCGNRGCLEAYVGGNFFVRQSGAGAKTVENRARSGNKKARKLYTYYGHWLGLGIVNFINLLEPEVIVIGGSIAHAWDLFMPQVKKEIKENAFSQAGKKVQIKKAGLGYRAPAIGAALLSKINTR